MAWVEFTPGVPDIVREYQSKVEDTENGITLYENIGLISAIRKSGDRYWIYETDFREMLEIDVTELQPGDVIWHCLDDGPVKSHEPYSSYPTEELVSFRSGTAERFGKPQKLGVLRGGQF